MARENCSACNEPVESHYLDCPACGVNLGPPNVREVSSPEERRTLAARFAAARRSLRPQTQKIFDQFAMRVQNNSRVTIAMPASMARSLVDDPRALYSSYELLVEGQVRTPAPRPNAAKRLAVEGWLFPGYGGEIRYGVLSLGGQSAWTYGDIAAVLKDDRVNQRTSFLEKNSFHFYDEHRTLDDVPLGHRASWTDRHKLAAAKLASALKPGQGIAEWGKLLVKSDGHDRSKDDFVEAHVFKGFNVNSIDSLDPSPTLPKGSPAAAEAAVIADRFRKR